MTRLFAIAAAPPVARLKAWSKRESLIVILSLVKLALSLAVAHVSGI